MKFHTVLELGGKTATGVKVPAEVVDALSAGKRPAVTVTIGTHTYRSTIAVMGGRYMLPVSAENREAAGIKAGDELEVEVELDTAPREVDVPADFAEALQAASEATTFFEGLSNSLKRYWVLNIEGAKTQETRQRRIDGAIAKLREGKSR
jgi:bifunctional DNA-binding transcriptional regulator/antitoxin component of YhaV-PrlF toxin-antitoxin module